MIMVKLVVIVGISFMMVLIKSLLIMIGCNFYWFVNWGLNNKVINVL